MVQFSHLAPKTPNGKLIYLSTDVRLETSSNNEDLNFFHDIHRIVNTTGYAIPRTDGFPNPYNIHLWDRLIWSESPLDTTTLSIGEITDNRSEEIAKIARKSDLPIVVSYSGGIDSTLILAAIFKNWEQDLLDRVIVKMTNASYYENPFFFRDIIFPNFKITNELIYDWNNAIIIAGEPGDAINLPNVVVEMDFVYPGSWQWSARTNPDVLIQWMAKSSNISAATRYYETMIQNGIDNGFQIETYEDFFWYGKQVLAYACNCMKLINQYATSWDDDSWAKFQTNAIAWFDTKDYRLWSATHRNTGVKFNGNAGDFKQAFKRYIYEIYKDPYYLHCKMKTYSPFPHKIPVAALYDDGTCYFLDS